MNILALIPARMNSSRFPGKPMTEILGKPMIGHVFHNVMKCDILSHVAVATCDDVIYDYINSIGGDAVMTGNHHERATDRCAEALKIIEKEKQIKFDIVIMVQGDEPMTNAEMIIESSKPLIGDKKNNILVTNLFSNIESDKEFNDTNCIKVVCDKFNNAIYFSREPIPTKARNENNNLYKQVCVISFRRDFLFEYIKMEPTPLEIAESIDMLRIIENGYNVKMVHTNHKSYSIDTYADRVRVENFLTINSKKPD